MGCIDRVLKLPLQLPLPLPLPLPPTAPLPFGFRQRTTLKVLEELSESVFNLQVPLQLLKCYIKEDRKLIEDIRSLGHVSEMSGCGHCNMSLSWWVWSLQHVLVVVGVVTAACPCRGGCGHCSMSLSWWVWSLQHVLVVVGVVTAACPHHE